MSEYEQERRSERRELYTVLGKLIAGGADYSCVMRIAIEVEDSDALCAILTENPALVVDLSTTLFQQDYAFCRKSLCKFLQNLYTTYPTPSPKELELVSYTLSIFRFDDEELPFVANSPPEIYEALEALLRGKVFGITTLGKMLKQAAMLGYYRSIRLLLTYGAPACVPATTDECSPLALAIRNRNIGLPERCLKQARLLILHPQKVTLFSFMLSSKQTLTW